MSKHSNRGHHGAPDVDTISSDSIEEHAGHRHARLSRILREEVGALVREELSDPRLEGVIITAVELSVDYRNVRVGFIVDRDPMPGRDERDLLERRLAKATPFLRARLADSVDLKQIPNIRFAWDRIAAEAPRDVDAALAGAEPLAATR